MLQETCMEINSSTPREAALKAATRNITSIYLVELDNGKLHVFDGGKHELREEEHTEFTRKRNITSKPVVNKIAYRNMKKKIHKTNLEEVFSEFMNMS